MACMTPYIKNDKVAGCVYTLPCGKCPDCSGRRVSGWSFRLMQEEKYSTSCDFITLTYAPEQITKDQLTPNGLLTLCKRDVQLFFKKLRKNHEKYNKQHPTSQRRQSIKYYLVGEYGGRSGRPHYHVLLYNARRELIQPAWTFGQIHYGGITGASIGYCLKYISKGRTVPVHCNDDRLPEFSLCSKGLGAGYLTSAAIKFHKSDLENRFCLTGLDGVKYSLPRYYKDRIYDESEREKISCALRGKFSEQLEQALADPAYNLNRYNYEQAKIAAFRAAKKSQKDKL